MSDFHDIQVENPHDWAWLPPFWRGENIHPFWCFVLMLVGGSFICAFDTRLGPHAPLVLPIIALALPYTWFIGRKTVPSPTMRRVMRWVPLGYGILACGYAAFLRFAP